MVQRGKFISVEGIEGVGKSSNIDVLVQHIEQQGYEVVTTREPGGTPLAEEIRHLLKQRRAEAVPEIAELLLMFASRALNVENVIRPALDAGKWVVTDRFTDSSRAYQGGGRGLDASRIDQLADWVHGDCWPDLTILLDAPAALGLQRASNRGDPDRFEQEKLAFFERVRSNFLDIAACNVDRFRVIDTTQSLPAVNRQVIAAIEPLFQAEDNSSLSL